MPLCVIAGTALGVYLGNGVIGLAIGAGIGVGLLVSLVAADLVQRSSNL